MRLLSAFVVAFLCCANTALAAELQPLPSIEAVAGNFVREKVAGQPGEYAISVTRVDPRLKLAKCDRMEAFASPGSKLWGRVSIGVRCDAPTTWSLYIPVHIKVTADVLVAAHPIGSNKAIQADDVQLQKKDVTSNAGSVLTSLDQAIGKYTVSNIQTGTIVRSEMLRAPLAILQGQQVKLVAQGAGFKITSEGYAMGSAAAGQVVSVKTRSGQIIKGIARGEGVVEVYF